MYKIYCNDVCIYDDIRPDPDSKVISPKLTLEENSAGQLSFIMPPGNIGYEMVGRMSSLLSVTLDDSVIWEGRVISENCDYYNQRNVTCEGALAFLNDTIQPPAHYTEITPRIFLERLIAIHNANSQYKFTVGIVTVTDGDTTNNANEIERYTNYESTLTCIKEKLVDRLKGFIRIRKENGVRYIDYLADYIQTNQQTIRFETNLLDFTKSWDLSDMATVIVPRGCRLEEQEIEGLESYLTVKTVNQGSIYVKNTAAISNFGWVCKVVDWQDVTVASNLLTKAQNYLANEQFDQMTLEINAVDLHYLSKTEDPFKLYQTVRCVSRPHGMDRTFPITKMEIQIDNPENTTYTLGMKETKSLTAKSSQINSEISAAIDNLPSKSEILRSAQENAKNMLLGAEGGVVKFVMNNQDQITQIHVQNQMDDSQVTQRWMWNINGLGYTKKVNGQWQTNVAMTMDGKIVADFITSGTMYADRIKGGTLTLGGNGNGNGRLLVNDASGNTIGQINNAGIAISAGSINLNQNFIAQADGTTTIRKGSFSLGSNFSVSEAGILRASGAVVNGAITATSGRIGQNTDAWNIGAQSIYNGCTGVHNGGIGTYVGIDGFRNNANVDGVNYWVRITNGEINSNNINAQGGSIAGFTINSDKLAVGDAEISRYRMSCGLAGSGIVHILGNSNDQDAKYGMLQLSNSGNWENYTCLDGIQIYGNGKIVKFGGDGSVEWEKWLSNIPG